MGNHKSRNKSQQIMNIAPYNFVARPVLEKKSPSPKKAITHKKNVSAHDVTKADDHKPFLTVNELAFEQCSSDGSTKGGQSMDVSPKGNQQEEIAHFEQSMFVAPEVVDDSSSNCESISHGEGELRMDQQEAEQLGQSLNIKAVEVQKPEAQEEEKEEKFVPMTAAEFEARVCNKLAAIKNSLDRSEKRYEEAIETTKETIKTCASTTKR